MNISLRGDGFEEILACPICGSRDLKPFPEAEYHLNLVKPLGILRCKRCGLNFMSPRPDHLLRDQIFSGHLPSQLQAYGKTIAYGEITNLRSVQFQSRLNKIANVMGERNKDKKTNFLDIGSANGLLVHLAQENGWKSYGLEASVSEVTKIADPPIKSRITVGMAEALPFPANTFSVIHAHHVWEHLLDPLQATKCVYDSLESGGIFYCEVPNQFDNIMFRRDMLLHRVPQRERNMFSIHHNYFYSQDTFRLLFKEAGFSKIFVGHKYEWPIKGWRSLFTIFTRLIGAFHYGGSLIYAYMIK